MCGPQARRKNTVAERSTLSLSFVSHFGNRWPAGRKLSIVVSLGEEGGSIDSSHMRETREGGPEILVDFNGLSP